ncbi:MAG: GNAT family N-acetyltransferase [Propionibacteriaceae bacterium]
MTGEPPKRWRVARSTLVAAITVAVVGLVVLAVLAWTAWSREGSVPVAVVISLLALAGIAYVWRFALHPRVHITADEIVVRNPLRTTTLPLDDLSVVAPGENGMVLATDEESTEAWCIQKSLRAIRAARTDTRADRIATEMITLLDVRDQDHPDALPRHRPDADGFAVRRAVPSESAVLADLERQASEAALGHLFGDQSYPLDEVTDRWRRVLGDPALHVRIGELDGEPIGYLAYSDVRVHHLGVRPDRFRKGYGSRLLDYATGEIFDRLSPQAHLWVLVGNTTARGFYAARGWEPSGETGHSEFPPYPEEIQLVLDNPVAPRHGGR